MNGSHPHDLLLFAGATLLYLILGGITDGLLGSPGDGFSLTGCLFWPLFLVIGVPASISDSLKARRLERGAGKGEAE